MILVIIICLYGNLTLCMVDLKLGNIQNFEATGTIVDVVTHVFKTWL